MFQSDSEAKMTPRWIQRSVACRALILTLYNINSLSDPVSQATPTQIAPQRREKASKNNLERVRPWPATRRLIPCQYAGFHKKSSAAAWPATSFKHISL